MKNTYTNKVVWITGTSSGIGKETAFRFAEAGARLILTALEPDLLEQVREECLRLGAKAVTCLPFDLGQTDALPQLAQDALNAYGRIDVFYNNAGISQRGTTVETDMAVIRKVMDIDFYAPVILTKAVLPTIIAQGGGQLAVTTSIAGLFGFPLRCAYSSAKHARQHLRQFVGEGRPQARQDGRGAGRRHHPREGLAHHLQRHRQGEARAARRQQRTHHGPHQAVLSGIVREVGPQDQADVTMTHRLGEATRTQCN